MYTDTDDNVITTNDTTDIVTIEVVAIDTAADDNDANHIGTIDMGAAGIGAPARAHVDIAGIDSNRQYLVYKIIKPLEKNQGQLEHSTKPGVPVEIFTQNDLNRGFVLYHSPREIGIYPKDFAFTFIGMYLNRSKIFWLNLIRCQPLSNK